MLINLSFITGSAINGQLSVVINSTHDNRLGAQCTMALNNFGEFMSVGINTAVPTRGINEVTQNGAVGVATPCDLNHPRSHGAANIAQDLIKDGYLNQDSPLGRMVGKQMDKSHLFSSMRAPVDPGQVKSALEEVIKVNLGDIDIHPQHGEPPSESDYKSVMLNGLAKASLDHLLTKQGEGAAFSSKDVPLLSEVATFMDQNPRKFPAPDSGSWKNELREDSYLDVKEHEAFRGAVDLLGSELQNRSANIGSSKDRLGQASHDMTSLLKDFSTGAHQERARGASEAIASVASKANFAAAFQSAEDRVKKLAATATRENPPSIVDKMTKTNLSNAAQHAVSLAEQLSGYKAASPSSKEASLAEELKGAKAEISIYKLNNLMDGAVKTFANAEKTGITGPAVSANQAMSQREFQISLEHAATSVVGALVHGGDDVS